MLAVEEKCKYRDFLAYGGRPAGVLATAAWLAARDLVVPPRVPWQVTISLDAAGEAAPVRFADAADTRFHIAISSIEWGFFFCHHSRSSWIRITDVPFVHQCDDHALRFKVPPLRELGRLVRSLEGTYRVRFRREHAEIRSTILDSEPAIRTWVLADL